MLKTKGFTVIELVVAIAIIGILLSLAVPSFTEMLMNAKIRNLAGSMANGLNMAKVEAVRRNMHVRFQLTTTADDTCALSPNGASWVVSLANPTGLCGTAPSDTENPQIIQARGNENVNRLVVTATEETVIFNSLGRWVPNSVTNNVIDVREASGVCATVENKRGFRCLQVVVSPSGMVRVCDPALANTEPGSCAFGA